MRLLFAGCIFCFMFLSSCKETAPSGAVVEKSLTTSTDTWINLFDGTSTEGWRGFKTESLPPNWVIEDGSLKSLGSGGDLGGDIVYGKRPFRHFDLVLEWKISPGGNSGIFYHVQEGDKYKAAYETAPEYQLIDDLGFPSELEDWQMVGADYAMYVGDPETKPVKAAGEWNTSRILYTKDHVEHWLNGVKLFSFNPTSEDWLKKRNSGKWDDYPDYGKVKNGLIGLQDHGSPIWFKGIRIRSL